VWFVWRIRVLKSGGRGRRDQSGIHAPSHNTIHILLNVVLEKAVVLWRPGIYFINCKTHIGVHGGVLGARAPPERRKMGPNLQEKVVSAPPGRACTPMAQQESNVWGIWGDLDGGRG